MSIAIGPDMVQEDGAKDTAVFAKAAELLARPLSPTALEKETEAGGEIDTSAVVGEIEATAAIVVAPPGAPAAQEGGDGADKLSGGISAVVSDLSNLQREMKEKMQSPSFRKAVVPRVKRAEPRVLTEGERHDKLGEIDALELQLQEARGMAAAATAAANAAAAHVATIAGETVGADMGGEVAGEKGEDRAQQLAEERVRTRRQQEVVEKRNQERRAEEERRIRKLEAGEKAQELERISKERVQQRQRELRAQEQQHRIEAQREQDRRNHRAAATDELRQQAARRVAERDQAERRKVQELANAEAEARRWQEEANELRAAEGHERTRLRMQQRAQELRSQAVAEEEARRRRSEEEAAAAAERERIALLNQQRAQARAAEHRLRTRTEQEDHARREAEALKREAEHAELALQERQRRRSLRAADVPAAAPRASPRTGTTRAASEEPYPTSAEHEAAAPRRASNIPPKLPSERVASCARRDAVPRAVAAPVPAASKRDSNGSPGQGVDEVEYTVPLAAADSPHPRRAGMVAVGNADEPVRCTVGFFGVSDGDTSEAEALDDKASDAEAFRPVVPKQKAAIRPNSVDAHRKRTPDIQAPHAASRTMSRAYSQPPPRKSSVSSNSNCVESPATHEEPAQMSLSPGAASNPGDPGRAAQQRPHPWKQKSIQVQSTDYYLQLVKAARGQSNPPAPGTAVPPAKGGYSRASAAIREGAGAAAVGGAVADGMAALGNRSPENYAEQVRQRAEVVEAAQRREEGARFERGYAALNRVQQRAMQAAPSRGTSAESAPPQLGMAT